MSYYGTLITAIKQVIKENGNQEITGQILQDILVSMIDDLGAYPTFAGIVYPDEQEVATIAETETGEKMEIEQDANVFYLAFAQGQYSDFGIELDGEFYHIFRRTSDGWEDVNTYIFTPFVVEGALRQLFDKLSQISDNFENYSTTEEVAEAIIAALRPYITREESAQAIITALEPYAKTSEVATAITTALQPYATTEFVNQKLNEAREEVTQALIPYAKKTEVTQAINTALQPYMTSDQTTQAIADAIATALTAYSTTEQVTAAIIDALAPYSTTEQMNEAINEAVVEVSASSVDNELVSAAALNDLDKRLKLFIYDEKFRNYISSQIDFLRKEIISQIDTLRQEVINDELVSAAALTDLNHRINTQNL